MTIAYIRHKWNDEGEHHHLHYRTMPAWRHKDSYRLKGARKRTMPVPLLPRMHDIIFYIFKRRHGLKYDLLVKRQEARIHLYVHRV